jgi:alcohol dehydrogenase
MKQQYTFTVPSFVHFGPGVAKKAGEVALEFGAKKVLCIYDQGVAKIAAGIAQTLKDAGLEVFEFDGVIPNPTDAVMEEAAKLGREANVDMVFGIGGGSSIDTAKGVKVLLTNPSPINQYIGMGNIPNPTKPLCCIPTTAGTGSEVTSMTIITEPQNSRKIAVGGRYLPPEVAIVDPELTLGMPPAVTASTGMDALTHAIEAYTCKLADPINDALSLKAIQLIYNSLPKAVFDGEDLQARTDMLLGSMMAGIAFNNAFVALVHSIAHPLSARCNLPHGVANAAVLPYVMEYNAPVVPERTIDIGIAMGLNLQGLDKAEACKKVVDEVYNLMKLVKIPTLKEAGVPESILETIAKDTMVEPPTSANPRIPTEADVLAILKKAY